VGARRWLCGVFLAGGPCSAFAWQLVSLLEEFFVCFLGGHFFCGVRLVLDVFLVIAFFFLSCFFACLLYPLHFWCGFFGFVFILFLLYFLG